MDNLVKLNNIRNKFAHSMVVNVADKNANYAMALVSFRDDVNVTYYSPKEYDNLLMMINSCRIELELKNTPSTNNYFFTGSAYHQKMSHS